MGGASQAGERAYPKRLRIRVRGLVQGVGFRPHVHRTALRFGVTGFVLNDAGGVLIEAEGAALSAFLTALRADPPRLSRIDRIDSEHIPTCPEENGFFIRATQTGGALATGLPADAAVCNECLVELFDPKNRRYLHPFIACSHCGPRATIAEGLPYDRIRTTMAHFPMCVTCRSEYSDPPNRRFHAEPIACHECGPQLDMPVPEIAARIGRGEIVALKGLGGFHLACDARNGDAVARLRARKGRDGKPFAVMVLNAKSAAYFAQMPPVARDLLESSERPIVLLEARSQSGLAHEVSGGLGTLGLMFPYTPVHYLLFHVLLGGPVGIGWLGEASEIALVITSANRSGEPILADDRGVRDRLAPVADSIAGHDRPIRVRMDDSIIHILGGHPAILRRARGYVPRPVHLHRRLPPVLALGAHLKSTLTLTRGSEAFLSQHLGDLDNQPAVQFLRETVDWMLALLKLRPECVACDLHPDFASSLLAAELADRWDVPLLPVQHHHAHIAAVAAEHGVEGPLLGLALDGYGLAPDGEAWGGELLAVDGAKFERRGHLRPLPLPGGDRAAREPWRVAAAALHALGRTGEIAQRFAHEPQAESLAHLLERGLVPETSSAGRWFDAAAGLLGLCPRSTFEAEAPMRLEALARAPDSHREGWQISGRQLDLLPLLNCLADCTDPVQGANLFHGTFAMALTEWIAKEARALGFHMVALGGGCFANRVLTETLTAGLKARDLEVLLPRHVPPGDGGISFGQAYVAGRAQV